MEASTDSAVVEREIAIDASPETIWEFFTDPEKAVRWMGQSASLEPRPGGLYRVDVIPGHTATGEFLEVDPPHRLLHTWGWEPEAGSEVGPGSTTIEIELIPNGASTIVRFTHRGLPSSAAAESHAHGWDHYLARLTVAAAGGDAGRDPWLDRID